MGFKESIFPDNGSLLFISSGYKGWASFRAQTAGSEQSPWFPTEKGLWKAMQDSRTDGESLTDMLQSPRIKNNAYFAFKSALLRFLAKYYKQGVDYSPKLQMMPKKDSQTVTEYHEAIAERFLDAMDLNGFVPVATKYTSSENPSFYFIGFYDEDPTGNTNFLSRISNHIRPKHNSSKGEIDFFLGAFYDFDNDPKMSNPRANSLTIDLDSFDAFLAVKAASYRKRYYGDDVDPAIRSTFERVYRKEVARLRSELDVLTSAYIAALNALAVGLTYITRLTTPSLDVPPFDPSLDFSFCHVRRYPLLKGTGASEEARQEFLSLIASSAEENPEPEPEPAPEPTPETEDRQGELFDSPPAIRSASVPDPAGLLLSVIRSFDNAMHRLTFCEDLLIAHKDYLTGLLSQLEGFVDDKPSLMTATLSAIEALSGIVPDTLQVFDRLAGLLTIMRRDLDLLKDPANRNKVRSAGYPAWDSWWDSKVAKARFKGVSLLQSPAVIDNYFKGL